MSPVLSGLTLSLPITQFNLFINCETLISRTSSPDNSVLNPTVSLADIFLSFYYSAWKYMNMLKRISLLVTSGRERVGTQLWP